MQDVEDIYALSPMQHGLLFESVTADSTTMYIMQLEYALTGKFRFEDFDRAWQDTMSRHPILRSSFYWDDMEKPLQVVHKQVNVPVELLDWTAVPEGEWEEKVTEFRKAERAKGCDFQTAPLLRVSLLQLSENRFQMIWTYHHILMEGWSAALVLQEVLEHYKASGTGATLSLTRPRPYREYVSWCQAQDPKVAETFWRKELAGFQTSTRLGIDRSLTSLHTPVTQFDTFSIDLTEEETVELTAFAKKQELTLNTLVQGAWGVLLSSYSGEEDIVFGTVVSGRSVPLEGVEAMVGLFINLMPVRVQVSPESSLLPWLKALQVSQAHVREFEYCPLVEIKGWSEMPPGLPLFESLLVFQNWWGDLAASEWDEDLQVADVQGHHGSPGHPMTMIVAPGKTMGIGISYDITRFDRESIKRLISNFRMLLVGLACDSESQLGDLPLLTSEEREQMLVEWNQTANDSGCQDPVFTQFERQAKETPEATAIAFGDQTISYRELDEKSNRVANHLRDQGVGEESRVALCTDRNPLMVIGMLGILKSGGAYVPLDPKHPKDRLKFLLEDSEVSILVTEDSLSERLPELSGTTKRVSLDGDAGSIKACSAEAPVSSTTPRSVAYMIYTSGSTGKPKGVMISHDSLSNYVAHAIDTFGMTSEDRMLQFASISFDTAAEEIYPALLSGATLVLRDDDMLGSVSTFLETCAQLKISIVDFPTAYWHVIVEGLDDAKVPGCIRLAILGGERANPEQLADWFRHVGPNGPRLLNTYGPTEATIVATIAELKAGDEPTRIVPIGRPVRNVEVYVLDPRGEPVPIGVPGELHIAGAGLAVGYYNQPELTAERFIANPFSSRADSRMYRTGDLVRYRPDGNLEFVGRRDSQVKFRGYRIELQEIESTLAQHEDVHEVVVLLREDQPGKQRLVGYVVARAKAGEAVVSASELRRELGDVLPAYMVPSAIVFLDAMPLTPHGKIDTANLPIPDRSSSERESGFVAPRNEMETTIANIWLDVLDVDRVGSHDNFFDLGGHSLLLMTVISELKKQLNVKLTPGELVLPTVGQLAKLCEERQKNPTKAKETGGLMKKLAGWYKRS